MIAVRSALILAFACVAIAPALAQDDPSKPLTGSFYMAPSVDAEDPKAPADHIVLSITGDAAKSMWDAMKVKTEPDECIGRMARQVQGMVCYGPGTTMAGPLGADDSPFMCIFGIDMKNASVAVGQDC
jgi:hypothetical protein